MAPFSEMGSGLSIDLCCLLPEISAVARELWIEFVVALSHFVTRSSDLDDEYPRPELR